jgi:hypothetical protein
MTREHARVSSTFTRIVLAAAASSVLLAGCSIQSSQEASEKPRRSDLGQPVAAAEITVSDLFVVTAEVMTTRLDGDAAEIVMVVTDRVLEFTDRPHRGATRIDIAELVQRWDALFGTDPPNAALTGTRSDGTETSSAVELTRPEWDPDTNEFTVRARPIGDDSGQPLPERLTDGSLFIDDASETALINIVGAPSSPVTVVEMTDGPPPNDPDFWNFGGWENLADGNSQVEVGATVLQSSGEGVPATLTLQNPTPGTAYTASLTLASQSTAGPSSQWLVTVTFDADGTTTGTVSMPQVAPASSEPGASLGGEFDNVQWQPGLTLPLDFSTTPMGPSAWLEFNPGP